MNKKVKKYLEHLFSKESIFPIDSPHKKKKLLYLKGKEDTSKDKKKKEC